MAYLSKQEAFETFCRHGSNSSHFVWFLTDLQYYQTNNGWVFGFRQQGRVTIFALEPLIPQTSPTREDFSVAWSEIVRVVQPKISFFVSVYDSFFQLLKEEQFQGLQVGKEPYVDLKDCIPTGKSGKGVRAARNQALRAGIFVEAWSGEKIQQQPKMKAEMMAMIRNWKNRNLIDLGGFLNAVDPFAEMQCRKYYLAFSQDRTLQAFLVATPIPGKNSYFLEDMVLRKRAARGVGELLTLQAMVSLAEAKSEMASLGVVSLTSINDESGHNLPPLAKTALITLPKQLSRFYNVDGLETFRKRFKPSIWKNIFLAVKNSPQSGISDSYAWFLCLFTLISAFRPKLNVNRRWLAELFLSPLRHHAVSYIVTLTSSLIFLFINKGGELPKWALEKFGFHGTSPISEWFFRSITSDFVYFDFTHFATVTMTLFFLIRWAEKTHSLKFVATLVAMICIFDDILNQALLVQPYYYFNARIFDRLVNVLDVGGSLWVAVLLGLQLCQLRRNRELFFTISSLGIVLFFAFSASNITNMILNLNHFLFLSIGYMIGKAKFEQERKISRRVASMKPPETKMVHAKVDRDAA